ncbi:choice-of-anchor D domain-containing protein, partial [Dokdonia sp.]
MTHIFLFRKPALAFLFFLFSFINATSTNLDIAKNTLVEAPTYCNSSGANDNIINDITRVIFNGINNFSLENAANPGYTDFTGVSTDVETGLTYNLEVQATTANFFFRVGAYIDWNRDGDFDDVGENYDMGNVTNGFDTSTSNSPLAITVPVGAEIGSTRMRISIQFNAIPGACEMFTFGEVEDYTLNIRPTVPAPEINITGLGNDISNGDITPDTLDNTDFGSIATGSSAQNTFNIENLGNLALTILGTTPYVSITGADAALFNVSTAASNTVAADSSSPFIITYSPISTGIHNATVTITSDDGDENVYVYSIRGTAIVPTPEISITGNGNEITDGDIVSSVADNTDFGVVLVGDTNENEFIIVNTGTGDLNLTDPTPYISLSGSGSSEFNLSLIPSDLITSGGGTTVFRITYSPTVDGTHTATISIANSDSDEASYVFDIVGTTIPVVDPTFTVYYENFDTDDGNWVATNPGGNSVWTYGTNAVETGAEGNYWYTNNYNNYASNSNTVVTSPIIDLTNYNNLELQIDIRHITELDTQDGFNMEYSTNGGVSWILLGEYSAVPVDHWYNIDDVSALGSGVDGWAGRNNDTGSAATQSSFVTATIRLPGTLNNNAQTQFRLTFASNNDGVTDVGVDFDNVVILGNPATSVTDPSLGPGDVTSDLRLWLKSNVGIPESDGNTISSWNDEAFDNDARVANNVAPTYYDNSTENINHNPVLDFDIANGTELKGKGGFFTDEYWIVMQADGTINNSSTLEGVISGRITPVDFAEDGTGFWINPGSIRFDGVDNIVSHMVGSTPQNLAAASDESYGRAYTSSTGNFNNEVIIFNVKYDPILDQSEIYKNGIRIDNYTGRTFNQSTGVSDGDLPYGTVDNSIYVLGVGRITVTGTPFDSHFSGKITEVISYASPNSITDQLKIQSYLAIKNGITNHDINSATATDLGDENYVDSDNNVVWDVITHTGFNYDIAGIGRDDDSGLNQKQSTSINPGSIVTMGLTDIYDTNNDNIASNANTFSDKNFLLWGNDNDPLAAAAPIAVDMSAGITGLN